MKERLVFPCLLLAIAIISVTHAQDGGPGRRPGGQGRPDMMRRMPLMLALDANNDGIISPDEINGAPAALRKLDRNGDGSLTEEELRPSFPEGQGGRREEEPRGPSPDELVNQLLEFDRNGDGQLSKSELPERMQGLFERGDANKDGILSKDEIRKLAESQSGRRRGEQEDRQNDDRRPPQRPLK